MHPEVLGVSGQITESLNNSRRLGSASSVFISLVSQREGDGTEKDLLNLSNQQTCRTDATARGSAT